MFTIFQKELRVYFYSLLGYILLSVTLGLAGWLLFTGYFLKPLNTNDFSGFWSDFNTILLFVTPMLSIRMLVEDKRLGTYELLLTSPVSPWGIILGKFLAALSFMGIMLLFLMVLPVTLSFFTPLDWGSVFSGLFGIILSVGFFIALGIFASSLTDNYVLSGVLALGLSIVLLVISLAGGAATGAVAGILNALSFSAHYSQFAGGVIHLKDFLYFVLGAFFWLFLAKTIVETRTLK